MAKMTTGTSGSSSSVLSCSFILPSLPHLPSLPSPTQQQPPPRLPLSWRFPSPTSLAALLVLLLGAFPQGLPGVAPGLLSPRPANAALLGTMTSSLVLVAPAGALPPSSLFLTSSSSSSGSSMESWASTLPSTSVYSPLPLLLVTASVSSPSASSSPSSPLPLLRSLCSTTTTTTTTSSSGPSTAIGVAPPSPSSFLRVIGQGASGITYILPSFAHTSTSTSTSNNNKDDVGLPPSSPNSDLGRASSSSSSSSSKNDGGDWVVKIGRGPAAAQALRNEASLLQRLAARGVREGVEEVVGLVTCDDDQSMISSSNKGKGKGEEERVVLAMRPYWPEAEQVDRVDGAAQVRALMRLLVGRVAVQGGVVLTDVQVLASTEEGEGGGEKPNFLLIDLTEGRALEEGGAGVADLRAYVGELATLIVPSVENHTAALREAEGMGSPAVLEMVRGLFPLARGGGG